MGYFDALTSSYFKAAPDGQKLFFPWTSWGSGYVLAPRVSNTLASASLPSGVTTTSKSSLMSNTTTRPYLSFWAKVPNLGPAILSSVMGLRYCSTNRRASSLSVPNTCNRHRSLCCHRRAMSRRPRSHRECAPLAEGLAKSGCDRDGNFRLHLMRRHVENPQPFLAANWRNHRTACRLVQINQPLSV